MIKAAEKDWEGKCAKSVKPMLLCGCECLTAAGRGEDDGNEQLMMDKDGLVGLGWKLGAGLGPKPVGRRGLQIGEEMGFSVGEGAGMGVASSGTKATMESKGLES